MGQNRLMPAEQSQVWRTLQKETFQFQHAKNSRGVMIKCERILHGACHFVNSIVLELCLAL